MNVILNIDLFIITYKMYKLYVSDREYKEVSVSIAKDLKPTDIAYASNKMFTQDIFDIIDDKIVVYHSTVKKLSIPAVLVLEIIKCIVVIKMIPL